VGVLDLVNHNLPAPGKEFNETSGLPPGSGPFLEAVLKSYSVEKQDAGRRASTEGNPK
jgi:hypothetical protein